MLAERKVRLPGAREPLVNREGQINPTWLRFFTDLYERTGGGPVDKVEVTAGATVAAQSAADTAQSAAVTAQAAAATAQSIGSAAEATADQVNNDLTELLGAVAGDATTLGFYGATPSTKPTITGATGANVALQNLLSALATLGLINDSTT